MPLCPPPLAPSSPKGFGPPRVLLSLALALSFLAACAEPLPPPKYATVTGLIPPNSAYALIATPTPGDPATFDNRLADRLNNYRDNIVAQHFIKIFRDVLGIDPLDPTALRAAGLDPQGDFAIISLDLWPAGLVRIADPEQLDQFLEKLRERLSPTRIEVDGFVIETLAVGAARLSIVRVQDYMVGVFHRDSLSPATLLSPLLTLDPASALGRSVFFDIILNSIGLNYGVLAFVNTRALDEALLSRTNAPADSSTGNPLLQYLSPDRVARYRADQTKHLEACADAGRFIADRIPYVALGSTLSDQRWHQRLLLSLDPIAQKSLHRIMPGLNIPLDGLFQDALIAFAFGVDIPLFAKTSDFSPSLTLCPNLAMFLGAAGVLGRSLAETNAHTVFGSSAIGALYNFDLKPGFLTKRSGVILLEAKQPQEALDGFDIFLSGLGFETIPDVNPGGNGRAFVALGAIVISVIPFPNHVALVLGEVPQASIDNIVQSPLSSPTPVDPSVALTPDIARLEIRGLPLQEMLSSLIDQLALLAPVNAEYARALLDAMKNIRSLNISSHFVPEALLIDWSSDLQSPSK